MSDTLPSLPELVRHTFRDPRAAARRVLALDLPERLLWEGLAVGVLLTVVLLETMVLAATSDAGDPAAQALADLYGQPFVMAAGQAVNSVVLVFAVFHIGRMFGGMGDRAGAVALVAWHQVVMLVAGIGVVLIGVVAPASLMSLLLVVLIGFYFYLLTQFVCALHGFQNGVPVFGMILLSMIAIYLAISVVTGVLAAIFLGGPPHV